MLVLGRSESNRSSSIWVEHLEGLVQPGSMQQAIWLLNIEKLVSGIIDIHNGSCRDSRLGAVTCSSRTCS